VKLFGWRTVFMQKRICLLLGVLAVAAALAGGLMACGNKSTTLTVEESSNRVAAAATHVAAIGLGEILKGVGDETQRMDLVRKFIDPVRFFDDKSGYFYVYYYNCVNLAHAIDKTLPGKDLTNYKDMKGNLVIQLLSARAKAGGGIVIFYWPHPETRAEMKKIGYVEPIPGTDYFIGTGYYPDTR
jgi:signal transduction histidine kinase